MPSRKRKDKYWLYIEPYVQITAGSGEVLFYNTLTKKRVYFKDAEDITRIASVLLNARNAMVTGITEEDAAKPQVKQLVGKLRSTYMGDLLDTGWSARKPVNFVPRPYVKSKLSKLIRKTPDDLALVNFDDYLHEFTIYLNSGPAGSSDPSRLAWKQFIFPGPVSRAPASIPVETLRELALQLAAFKLITLNFSGRNLFEYPDLGTALSIFKRFRCQKKFHILLEHFDPSWCQKLLATRGSIVAVYISFPFNPADFNRLIGELASGSIGSRLEFYFVLRSAPELEYARDIIRESGISHYYFRPLYDGTNLDFFRDVVFLTDEDILRSRPDQKQIFSRMAINEKDFGKFTLLPAGEVFANVNDPSRGKFPDKTVIDMILHELLDGKSWTRTRNKQEPCRQCIYQNICPPVSSYEILTGRYNFCHVYQNSGKT